MISSFRGNISHVLACCSIRYPRMMNCIPSRVTVAITVPIFQIDTRMSSRKTLEELPQSDRYHMPSRKRRIPTDLHWTQLSRFSQTEDAILSRSFERCGRMTHLFMTRNEGKHVFCTRTPFSVIHQICKITGTKRFENFIKGVSKYPVNVIRLV